MLRNGYHCNYQGNNPANYQENSISDQQLLSVISQSGFAMYDMLLYLDTHPNDGMAIAYYQKQAGIYKDSVEKYERQYGPLIMNPVENRQSDAWEWTLQPWPWERKGGC